jgi:putative transposase
MEAEFNHLNHATWECKYHVVFTPKYRKKLLFGKIKRHLGQVFHDLARRKECRIEEGHLMPDHVHMLISIPPKYSVAQIIGYMKGKSSIWIAQNVERKMRNFLGHKFWARGYFVTTVGRDEEVIRAYIRNQELADRQLEQFELKISAAQNPINRPNIPQNRLWRFPIKPPALLEVIGFPRVTSGLRSGCQLHPVVLPHVSHFMHVPFRTSEKCPHSPHISPS